MDETKKCPACAEEIKYEAKKCRYCGEILERTEIFQIPISEVKEITIYTTKAHWINYILPILICFTLYGIPIGVYYICYHKTKQIELTNKKLTYAFGLLNRKTLSLKTQKIESIDMTIDIIERIFGTGQLIITGTGGNSGKIPTVDNPKELKEQIEKVISRNM